VSASNRNVFSLFLKVFSEVSVDRKSYGRLFHTVGPRTEKRLPLLENTLPACSFTDSYIWLASLLFLSNKKVAVKTSTCLRSLLLSAFSWNLVHVFFAPLTSFEFLPRNRHVFAHKLHSRSSARFTFFPVT